MNDLIEITTDEMIEFCKKWVINPESVPKNNYYAHEDSTWFGLYNEDGNCWTEEFASQQECFDWFS